MLIYRRLITATVPYRVSEWRECSCKMKFSCFFLLSHKGRPINRYRFPFTKKINNAKETAFISFSRFDRLSFRDRVGTIRTRSISKSHLRRDSRIGGKLWIFKSCKFLFSNDRMGREIEIFTQVPGFVAPLPPCSFREGIIFYFYFLLISR